MRSARSWAALASVGLIAAAVELAGGAAVASAASRTTLKTATPASERADAQGAVPSSATVSFDVTLPLKNAKGAASFAQSVSNPKSAQYHKYLTDSQWVSKYGPTSATVAAAKSWLKKQGFQVGAVPKSRMFVAATGTAAQVENAFSTSLSYYQVNGHKVRLASSSMSIPSSEAGTIAGVTGVNQYVMTPSVSNGAAVPASKAGPADAEPPPPAGFRNPQPCSNTWGAQTDTTDSPSLYAPFTSPQPYDICGYSPDQMRSGYNLGSSVRNGNDGSGVTMAIVDAYDSPTLLSDAQHYANLNDPLHPLANGQFVNVRPTSVQNADVCDGSGWYAEQALDVESSHAMAPGANIVFVGAKDCFDNNLLTALTTAVTSGASVVSDSWGDVDGDLLEDAAAKNAFDNTFEMAAGTGVSVLFSSGDDGDNFAVAGIAGPDFPPSDPLVTAVGGTTLELGAGGTRAEYGWSTAKQVMCTSQPQPNCGTATTPAGPLLWNAGGGGGTSYTYLQPDYQAGVVPSKLALRNQALFGPQPLRVEPDISLDADAQSGFRIGLTQTFGSKVEYSQFKEGGTSLASPLLAGIIADTDQAGGGSLGFANPALYEAFSSGKSPNAFHDIVPPADPNSASVVRVDYTNTQDKSDGYTVSLRAINYAGKEQYCDVNCETRKVSLTATKGFDSLTVIGSVGSSFIAAMKRFAAPSS
jgi:subtilase family serine protease